MWLCIWCAPKHLSHVCLCVRKAVLIRLNRLCSSSINFLNGTNKVTYTHTRKRMIYGRKITQRGKRNGPQPRNVTNAHKINNNSNLVWHISPVYYILHTRRAIHQIINLVFFLLKALQIVYFLFLERKKKSVHFRKFRDSGLFSNSLNPEHFSVRRKADYLLFL